MVPTPPAPPADAIRLMAVGDIMLGEHPLCLGHGVATTIARSGPRFVFDKVAPLLKTGSIVFGNLENVLADPVPDPATLEHVYLRGSPESVKALGYAGFNVLNLANNHALQYGPAGLHRTMSLLDQSGIRYVGIRDGNIAVFNFGFLSVGFLGYCTDQQYERHTPYVEPIDLDLIRGDIQRLKRDGVHCVVVSLHWGDEFVHWPSPGQVELGRAIIDLGASLILGHHPHIVHLVERYRDGLIAYSLGNFLSDMRWSRHLRQTIILTCDLSSSRPIRYSVVPLMINPSFQPEPCQERPAAPVLRRLRSDVAPSDTHRYRRHRRLRKQANRLRMYLYYLSHLHRYPGRLGLQLLRFFLEKKRGRFAWTGKRLFGRLGPIR